MICSFFGGRRLPLSRFRHQRKIYQSAAVIVLACVSFLLSCMPAQNSIKPPSTEIVRVQPKYGASGVVIEVSGRDERTPVEELFYVYWVGTTIESTTTSTKIRIDSHMLGEGTHTFRVAAVNQYNLADPEPPQREFKVDLTPPPTPTATAYLESGQIYFSLSVPEPPNDFAGYSIQAQTPGNEPRVYTALARDHAISAERTEYAFQVKAFDDVGNHSQPFAFALDLTEDRPPYLNNALPERIGSAHREIELDVRDDWDHPEDITIIATLTTISLEVRPPMIRIPASHQPREGKNTLSILLIDKQGNQTSLTHSLYIDLTPPETPYQPKLSTMFGGYFLSWNLQDDAQSYRIYGLNEGEDDWVLLEETRQNQILLSERFLQYSVSALDRVDNESLRSYPVRTYPEKYVPVVSAEEMTVFQDNTLLTTLFSPYIIRNPVQIPQNVTVALERGIEIIFEEEGRFEILGELITYPSETERRTRLRHETDSILPGLIIQGGSVWLENLDSIGNGGTWVQISHHGSFQGINLSVSGFEEVFRINEMESLLISNSQFETGSLIRGSNAKNTRIMDSIIHASNAIDLIGAVELCISGSIIQASETGIQLRDLSNLQLTQTSIHAPTAVEATKFCTIDGVDVFVESGETGFLLSSASTLNLRRSEIMGATNGIHIRSSGYLYLSESLVQNCITGIRAENSDLRVLNTHIRSNRIGMVIEGRHTLSEESVTYSDNEHDAIRK